MKPKLIHGVPVQIKGSFHDTESIQYSDTSEITEQKFEVLKQRFFDINKWMTYCGKGFADFNLYDETGRSVFRKPETNDFIRIDIPGPGNFEAEGFDWVEIVNIEKYHSGDIIESYIMTCRPSKIPYNKINSHIAHFYSDKSTSTFIISKGKNFIKAGIHGRNEFPNFNADFQDKIRNFSIAVGGMLGISKIQWKRLSDGLIKF